MKSILAFFFLATVLFPVSSFGEDSQYCTQEYFKKISTLYQNRNPETAKIIFQVLCCGDQISKESKRGQFTALVGGYMQENPSLIDHLFTSASSVKNTDAAKIYLDGLWLCSTNECRNKLKERPFQLPAEDVNNLLAESPPDLFSMPINDPATLDFLWGFFFGAGDTKIVDRVYQLLADNWKDLNSSDPIGANRRMLLAAARWSLVSIASQHEFVKDQLEKKNSTVAQALLKEIEMK
ncbi:MAG: hypothetical protein VR65_04055 [Desulfobulbaceae bacterium BRH_c16a]|nr:MAG: hypothetical protein VR65_04055 [Desulfobulbaceae bacterium BRH_c16a]